MSLDRSLKSRATLARHRNVLTRAERLKTLEDEERWRDGTSMFGLPKVAHRKSAVGGKTKKKAAAEGAEAGTPAAAAADAGKAPAGGAKPAAGKAAAKPAAGKAASKPAK